MRKYKQAHGGLPPEYPPLMGRPLSPAALPPSLAAARPPPLFTHDPQEMDVDHPPGPPQLPGRPTLSEARLRTPLPSGRSLEKLASAALPGIDTIKADFQGAASRIVSNPHRCRYSAAQALLLYWADERDPNVAACVRELGRVLKDHYSYTFEIDCIPSSSDEQQSSFRWLSRRITRFVDDRDHRDVLKIVYYNGHTFLDENREMVLARYDLVSLPPLWPRTDTLDKLSRQRSGLDRQMDRHPTNTGGCLL